MKNFALIGAAGYIAPRHFQAIKMTENNLLVAMDISDSVGLIDSYFPKAEFFAEFGHFSEFIDQQTISSGRPDYIVVCSPNYCHLEHIKFGLERGIDVICEKPLVLSSNELETLMALENTFGARVYSILQLRLHPSIIALRQQVQTAPKNKIFDLDLTYITSRGNWYLKSWKGAVEKSGGLPTNIGVHFYDMLHYIFGEVLHNEVHFRDNRSASGYLEYDRARVKWFLSIDSENLPIAAHAENKMTYRSITLGDQELEFSTGFADLHLQSYQNILEGNGFGIDENRVAIKTVEEIRNRTVVNGGGNAHSLLENII